MVQAADPHPLLTLEETRQFLPVGRTTIYDLARRGILPTVRIGRKVYVSRETIARIVSGELQLTPPDSERHT